MRRTSRPARWWVALARCTPSSLLAICLLVGVTAEAPAQHEIDPETWVQMRKFFGTKGPAPSIAEDIAALNESRQAAKRAGPRLIERGPEALPQLHAALLAPEATDGHIFNLLQVLGGIGHRSSADPIVQLAESRPEPGLQKSAFLALAGIPQTEASIAFTIRVAERDGESWYVRRMIFTYFGMHRDPRGRKWAEPLLDHPEAEQRAAALFVLARLGDPAALEPITQMLTEGAPANSRGVLLLALAELVDASGFEARAPASFAWSDSYRDALRYAKYRTVAEPERPALCVEMLRAEAPGHAGIAVRCLLERGLEQELLPAIALDLEAPGRPAFLKSEIRKAGYRVIDTEDEFRIEPVPPGTGSTS